MTQWVYLRRLDSRKTCYLPFIGEKPTISGFDRNCLGGEKVMVDFEISWFDDVRLVQKIDHHGIFGVKPDNFRF